MDPSLADLNIASWSPTNEILHFSRESNGLVNQVWIQLSCSHRVEPGAWAIPMASNFLKKDGDKTNAPWDHSFLGLGIRFLKNEKILPSLPQF